MLNIAEGLRQRGARAELVRTARQIECHACAAHGVLPPRPFTSHAPVPNKFEIIESDFGCWRHPFTDETTHLQLNIDVGQHIQDGQGHLRGDSHK